MNRRWPALLLTIAFVATSCTGGGGDSAATTEKPQSGEGGTVPLHKDGTYGPLDATVVVDVPTGSG